MKKSTTKKMNLTMLLAAAMPMIVSNPVLAGPGHDHGSETVTTDAPTMDAKAKAVWDKAIDETLGENAEEEPIKTMRLAGTMLIPAQGITATMNILIASGQGMHVSMEIPGIGAFEQGVSGDVVWSSNMMEGPKIVEGDEAKQLIKQLDLYADLNWEKYYQSITFNGQETITLPDDTEIQTNVLELVSIDDGTISTQYYNTDTGLLAKAVSTVATPGGGEMPSTIFPTDYREIEGFMIPFKTISSSGPMQQIIEFSEVLVNDEIKDSELDLPEEIKELMED